MAKKRTVPAAKFKAECLRLIDHVAESREIYVITKHGRPLVQVVPFDEVPSPSLRGSVKTKGDIVAPILDDWEMGR